MFSRANLKVKALDWTLTQINYHIGVIVRWRTGIIDGANSYSSDCIDILEKQKEAILKKSLADNADLTAENAELKAENERLKGSQGVSLH